MTRTFFKLLPAILFWLGSCAAVLGQDAPVAQSDQIAQGGQIIQDDDSSTGTFTPVSVNGFTTSDVALQFSASLAGKAVAIQALDGGTLSATSGAIDANGNLAFSFQVSDQPGIHRVIVIDPNADDDSLHIIGLVQFEVAATN